MQRMFNTILSKRGIDVELIQVITGYGATGAALCSSGVDKILFIGSVPTGKRVMAACSSSLTPVTLELGGKDPLVLLDDCDFEQASEIACRGVFTNMGQNCVSACRHLVSLGFSDPPHIPTDWR